MKILYVLSVVFLFAATFSGQTIKVNPTGVNVNSQNPTTVFLTFGQIPPGYLPAEAIWCGELIPAPPPALGLQCRPGTIFGSLPIRFNLSRTSGNAGFTDIMSIPPAVVRRAFQAALNGGSAGFFYVRRFISTSGLPDQFVFVTCRMTGGGARSPFALTGVQFVTSSDEPVLFLKRDGKFPAVSAEITYNGTGRLKGRWEIVQPGEIPPSDTDLLTEATLPVEARAGQRRYTQIERFDHFLMPTGKFTLKLENSERIPLSVEGRYLLLLRVEAVDDKEGDSNLRILEVGNGTVHSGAVAGFPLPTLTFFVGGGDKNDWETTALLSPPEGDSILSGKPSVFVWRQLPGTFLYRLEFLEKTDKVFFSALLPTDSNTYRVPSWFFENIQPGDLSWRISAFDEQGRLIRRTNPKRLQF